MYKYLISISLFLPLVASAAFNKDLYYGLQDAQVSELQEFLTDQGLYSGPITGNFFSLTLKAVKSFQTANLISPVSGYFGPLTRTKANSILTSAGVTSSGVTTESGTIFPSPITPPKTTDDVVAKLMEQIALIKQQLTILQVQQQKFDTQQQTLSQQASTLGAIQQEQVKQTEQLTQQTQAVQQIQTNTTPPPPPPPPPPIPTVTLSSNNFRTAEGIYIVDDGRLTLIWTSTNANSCTGYAEDYVSGYVSSGIRDPQKWGWYGEKSPSGTQTIIPLDMGDYKLWIECRNSVSSKQSERVTVRIRQLSQ